MQLDRPGAELTVCSSEAAAKPEGQLTSGRRKSAGTPEKPTEAGGAAAPFLAAAFLGAGAAALGAGACSAGIHAWHRVQAY